MTILFQKDWLKYPSARPDYTTTNTSFLRLVEIYHRMGVKNCLFPLALYQPILVGVDPFDPDLTDDLKLAVGLEVKYNYWYYIREVARIPPQSGNAPIMYGANRGNIYLPWAVHANADCGLIMPRQTGKSVGADCISNHVLHFSQQNATMSLITKDHKLRVANIERLKKMRSLLPPYLLDLSAMDADNQEMVTYMALENKYITGVAQGSETAANNMGRGFTTPLIQIDEGPFIKFIEATLTAALGGGLAARKEAARNGLPYCNIFTTTAGKKDSRDGRYMYEMFSKAAKWTEAWLDAESKEDLHEIVRKACTGIKTLINGTFSYLQLGKDDDWMEEAIRSTGLTDEGADRDLFNRWTSGTQSSPLSFQLTEIIAKSEKEPCWCELTPERYTFRWYIPRSSVDYQLHNEHYVLGCDPSEAVGRDDIGMVLARASNMEVVGAANINESNIFVYAAWLAKLLIKYPNITLSIEMKSTGRAIVDALILELEAAGIDPYRRIYNRVVDEAQDSLQCKERYNAVLHYGRGTRGRELTMAHRNTFGFVTGAASRKQLYGPVLQNSAKMAGKLCHDATLIEQILGLVKKDDRIDHQNSGHDDMVIAWLLCTWFLAHSRNLDEYGINTSNVLSLVNEAGEDQTIEDSIKQNKEKQRRLELSGLITELENVTDDRMAIQLEARIKHLVSLANNLDEATTITDLMRRVTERRQQQHTINRRRGGLTSMGYRR